jgi:predicted RecA/RadA family phage recombinase
MATNHIQLGDVMPWTNSTGADVLSGAPALIGERLGVALGDIADGASGSVAVCEVFTLPKEAALAVAQGATLYWDDTNKVLTTTATANTLAGFAFAAALAADATVEIKLNA